MYSDDFGLQVSSIHSHKRNFDLSLFLDQHSFHRRSTSLPLGIMHSEDFDLLVDMTFTENYFHDFHLQVTSPYSF
ncbi:unnamed protein product [Rotaria magnacalcarata]|uniref:Uncharacterized protein n=1 Tax=Rotaria magnacalcarata TaxID=392030 RepID=A0A816NCU2_9BILA|nr:unnamed protein product [Rotaria magnacalcarata]